MKRNILLLCLFSTIAAIDPATTTALVTGIIGYTIDQLSKMDPFVKVQGNGGCFWYGTAPACVPHCPSIAHVMEARNSAGLFNEMRIIRNDRTYGHPCATGHKSFCCHVDSRDATWEGSWRSAQEHHRVYICNFNIPTEEDPSSVYATRCGELKCTSHKNEKMTVYRIKIHGNTCTDVTLIRRHSQYIYTGSASIGHVVWSRNGTEVDSWFKCG